MHLTVHGPRHFVLTTRRALAWILLAFATALTVAAITLWVELGFPGVVLVGVILSLLLVTGAVVALRRRTELEVQADTVRYARTSVFGDEERRASRADLLAVLLRARIAVSTSSEGGTNRYMSYEVVLQCRPGRLPAELPLASGTREHRLRHFAERLCHAAEVPLVDAIGERSAVRGPGALDGPPATRLRAPRGPLPAGLALTAAAGGHPIATCGRLPPGRRFVAPCVALASLFATGLAGVMVTGGTALDPTVWAALGAAEAVVLGLVAWLFLARCSVHRAGDTLHCVERVFGVAVRHRRLPVATIEQVREQGRDGCSPHLDEGVALVTDRGAVVVGHGLDRAGRRWLRAWLEASLWPHLPETEDP